MKKTEVFLTQRQRVFGNHRGIALLITLAAVVLLTVLVLAFFARAQLNRQIAFSSSNLIKAELLARSTQDWILGELKQEILEGSVALDGGDPSWPFIYQPLSRQDVPPRESGLNGPDTLGARTLLKVSAPGLSLRPSGLTVASDVLLDDKSANGRSYSSSRWFGSGGPGLGSQDELPAWFYVTRNNGIAVPAVNDARNSSSDDYVIGRFACTVYDTSGRLDANVAGYPAVAAALAADKTSVAMIDLSKVDSAFTYGGSGTIDPFISWRNGPDAASEAVYAAYLNGFASTNGFLLKKETHNAFLSRRDLLKGVEDGVFPGTAGLFSHFSHFSQAPSWGPTANAGDLPGHVGTGISLNYLDEANDEASSNRFIPNVRHPADATVTYYRDDGTPETYRVKSGDPLVQRRFSLGRLAWLTPGGPQSGKESAIEACFGLRWEASKWRWEYVAGKNAPGVRIKNLHEVAQEGREPNFIEILNAGILSGSLGRDPGRGFFNAVNSNTGVFSSFFEDYKAEKNLQILSIAANIIDQYDEDSYPTAIRFDAFGMTGADDLSIQTVYGQENLPYLHSLIQLVLADPPPPGAGVTGGLSFWMQPQLWNPNHVPSSPLAGYPAKFRAYAYGRVFVKWTTRRVGSGGGGTQYHHYGPPTDYDDGNGIAGSPGARGVIYFDNPPDATSPFYERPEPLRLDLATSAGNLIVDQANTSSLNYYDGSKWDGLVVHTSLGILAEENPFAGFSTVTDTSYDADAATWQMAAILLPDATRTAYFSLQYLGPDGNYHPYCFMARMSQSSNEAGKYFRANDLGVATGTNAPRGWGPIRMDPRTDRFSCYTAWYDKNNKIRTTSNQSNNSYLRVDGGGAGGPGDYGMPYIPSVFFYTPDYNPEGMVSAVGDGLRPGLWVRNVSSFVLAGGQASYYTDPDGVVRPGDGYRQNMASGDGGPLYLGSAAVSPASTIGNPRTGSALRRRALILNRPFRSVGELGYAYRDQPFKTLDFWSSGSADAALLDLFSVNETPRAVAGKVNPGSASPELLKALFVGTSKNPHLTSSITDVESQTLVDRLTSGADFRGNRAELASVLGPLVSSPNATGAFNTTVSAQAEWANKPTAEAPMRALANIAETRTWNLLVDVVVQTGRMSQNAGTLRDFIVEGEKRTWMHVAIDRFSGKILHKEIEAYGE